MKRKNEDIKRHLWAVSNRRGTIKQKISFYKSLIEDMSKVTELDFSKHITYWQEEIDSLAEELNQAIDEFDNLLEELTEIEKQVLILRYLHGIRWEYMESYTHYSVRQTIRIHDTAIDKIAKAWEKNNK